MATYERETTVRAPFDEVWDFHSRASGLEALTPGFMHLEVAAIRGPDGEADPGILAEGAEIEASMRPFGVGPRQSWRSVITARTESDDRAQFVDVMADGPFPFWEHTHTFFRLSDEETLIRDRVEYRLPGGELGRALSPFGVVGFEPMFRARHAKTKELLE